MSRKVSIWSRTANRPASPPPPAAAHRCGRASGPSTAGPSDVDAGQFRGRQPSSARAPSGLIRSWMPDCRPGCVIRAGAVQAAYQRGVAARGLPRIGVPGEGQRVVQREDHREVRRRQPAVRARRHAGLAVSDIARDERAQRRRRYAPHRLVDGDAPRARPTLVHVPIIAQFRGAWSRRHPRADVGSSVRGRVARPSRPEAGQGRAAGRHPGLRGTRARLAGRHPGLRGTRAGLAGRHPWPQAASRQRTASSRLTACSGMVFDASRRLRDLPAGVRALDHHPQRDADHGAEEQRAQDDVHGEPGGHLSPPS